jgi:hypothetical protein
MALASLLTFAAHVARADPITIQSGSIRFVRIEYDAEITSPFTFRSIGENYLPPMYCWGCASGTTLDFSTPVVLPSGFMFNTGFYYPDPQTQLPARLVGLFTLNEDIMVPSTLEVLDAMEQTGSFGLLVRRRFDFAGVVEYMLDPSRDPRDCDFALCERFDVVGSGSAGVVFTAIASFPSAPPTVFAMHFGFDDNPPAPIPEPSTLALTGIAVVGLVTSRGRARLARRKSSELRSELGSTLVGFRRFSSGSDITSMP